MKVVLDCFGKKYLAVQFGVRRQSEATTALWLKLESQFRKSKAVSPFAGHRPPN